MTVHHGLVMQQLDTPRPQIKGEPSMEVNLVIVQIHIHQSILEFEEEYEEL